MAKPEKKEKNKKEKKSFFKDFKTELKKVNWPTAKQLANNTTAVITIVLITALIVFVLDFAFEALNTYGINKLRSFVQTSTSEENTENNNDQEENEVSSNEENAEGEQSSDDTQTTENESAEQTENTADAENNTVE